MLESEMKTDSTEGGVSMKKFFILVIPVLMSIILAACGLTKLDSDSITTIPRSEDKAEPGNDAGQSGSQTNSEKSDLDIKGDVLQADTEAYMKSIIEERSREVLTAIAERDFEKLAGAVHPEKGVRFSPYGYVDTERDLVFTAEQISKMASDTRKYVWGSYDGSGEPIELTFSEYFSRFVYDVAFTEAEQVGYNRILGQGNSLNNSFEVYKNAIIVEYHFPGIDPQYEGMDWRSLRLVFEKSGDTWYLAGIIHDQWTI